MNPSAPQLSMSDLPGIGLSLVLIVLFTFLISLQGARQKRRADLSTADSTAPQRDGPKPSALPAPTGATQPHIQPVTLWLPWLFERAAHILILGGSGSGKTRTARGLVRYIVEQRRERVLLLDPKANRDTWMGLPTLVKAEDIAQAMEEVLGVFQARLSLNPTLTEAEADRTFERVWIVVDEVSFVRDACEKQWMPFLRRISSMARSLKLHLIIVNQSERVDELGLKGRGDLIANFAKINLSNAVWSGEPVQIDVGAQRVSGEWRSYFPSAHERVQLSPSAVFAPAELAQPALAARSAAVPVPTGTAAASGEPPIATMAPVPSTPQHGVARTEPSSEPRAIAHPQQPPATSSAKAASPAPRPSATPHAFASDHERIRHYANLGWSRNQIADNLGRRRSVALALIRETLGEG